MSIFLLSLLLAAAPVPTATPKPVPTSQEKAPATPQTPALPYGQDLRVPGSRVSVRLEKDSAGQNSSSIFLDEQYDTLGKTFVQFRCGAGGKLSFFLRAKVPLLSEADVVAGKPPALSYRVDGQQPRSFPGVLTRKGGDFDRYTLATNDANDARFLAAFKAARSKVELRVVRSGGAAPLTLNFPVRGLKEALNVVEGCAALP